MSKAGEFAEFCLIWFITIAMALIIAGVFVVCIHWAYIEVVERHYKHRAYLTHITATGHDCCERQGQCNE